MVLDQLSISKTTWCIPQGWLNRHKDLNIKERDPHGVSLERALVVTKAGVQYYRDVPHKFAMNEVKLGRSELCLTTTLDDVGNIDEFMVDLCAFARGGGMKIIGVGNEKVSAACYISCTQLHSNVSSTWNAFAS